jgi:tetratricopeptide (TPR) repeat protein
MAELERVLVPGPRQSQRQKIHVLHGLGGMGKTQLAVEFARRHHRRFSSVFWLDGRSEDTLKRSIASCASRIPRGQIAETSRMYNLNNGTNVDAVVRDVVAWLARSDNTAWLLIFDNVDREHEAQDGDSDAYDVTRYLSGADHGSVLVTTRLARLEQLGESQQLGKVSEEQGRSIFRSWYRKKHGKLSVMGVWVQNSHANKTNVDAVEREQLLALLDGLPLAIAQAGAYLQESGGGLATYLRYYEQQWSELMGSGLLANAPLLDYPGRSVWTTWVISYKAIRNRHEATANLLLLWSFLDNRDLWYGMFAAACQASPVATEQLRGWMGDIVIEGPGFSRSMQLLRNYSLIEEVEVTGSYATHPVVHRWTYHYEGQRSALKLGQLAIIVVGCAVPDNSEKNSSALQRRLMPHAHVCSKWLGEGQIARAPESGGRAEVDQSSNEKDILLLDATNLLGNLYSYQGKLVQAEQMYEQTLRGYKEVLGDFHTSTLQTVNNLGALYRDQGKLAAAEQMLVQALQGRQQALGHKHSLTLDTVTNLGILHAVQGRLVEAEHMCLRAMRGKEDMLGSKHMSTLGTVSNLGNVYRMQGKLSEAEKMYERALRGYEEALGSTHSLTLNTVNNLGNLYADQGKLGKAEQLHQRALRGYEKAVGAEHPSALQALNNLGVVYFRQAKLSEAEQMYERALRGREETLGPTHTSTLQTVNNLGLIYFNQGKPGEAKKMYERALRGREEALGPTHTSTLDTVNNLGNLYVDQGKLDEAEQMYERALRGYEALGNVRVQQYLPALNTFENMGDLYLRQSETAKAQAMYAKALSGLSTVLGQSSKRCVDLAAKIKNLSQRSEEREAHPELLTVSKGSSLQRDRKRSPKLSIGRFIKKVF